MAEIIKINRQTLSYNKIWYISVSGSDTTGDGTQNNPYATMEMAYTSAASGDAYYLTSAGTYALPATIVKNMNILGTGYDVIVSGGGYTAGVTLTFYRLMFNTMLEWYYSYTPLQYVTYTLQFFNCVLGASADVSSGRGGTISPYTLRCSNCHLVNSSSFGHAYLTLSNSTYIKNCTSGSASFTFASTTVPTGALTTSVANVSMDSTYKPTNITWLNSGSTTIFDPDDKRSSIGIYGGPYALGFWAERKYLLKDGNLVKAYQGPDRDPVTLGTYPDCLTPELFDYIYDLPNSGSTLTTSQITVLTNPIKVLKHGDYAYVLHSGANSIARIRCKTGEVDRYLDVGSPQGGGNIYNGTLYVYGTTSKTISKIDLSTFTVSDTYDATHASALTFVCASDKGAFFCYVSTNLYTVSYDMLSRTFGSPVNGGTSGGTLITVGDRYAAVYCLSTRNVMVIYMDTLEVKVTNVPRHLERVSFDGDTMYTSQPGNGTITHRYDLKQEILSAVELGAYSGVTAAVDDNIYVTTYNGTSSLTIYDKNTLALKGTYSTGIANAKWMALSRTHAVAYGDYTGVAVAIFRIGPTFSATPASITLPKSPAYVACYDDDVYICCAGTTLYRYSGITSSTIKLSDLTSGVMSKMNDPSILMWTDDTDTTPAYKLTFTPKPKLLTMTSPVNLDAVNLKSVNVKYNVSGTGYIGLIVSSDGSLWRGLLDGVVTDVDTSDLESVRSKSMSLLTFNSLTEEQLAQLFPDAKLMIGIYMEPTAASDALSIDSVGYSGFTFDIRTARYGYRVILNDRELKPLTSYTTKGDLLETISPVELNDGPNSVIIEAETESGDTNAVSLTVYKEPHMRTSVSRTFTDLDGGFSKQDVEFSRASKALPKWTYVPVVSNTTIPTVVNPLKKVMKMPLHRKATKVRFTWN